MDARAIEKLIYSESGLLGVSGISSDMRKLLGSEEPRAKLAVDLYVYRIRRELGSLAARARRTRCTRVHGRHRGKQPGAPERICRDAAWLGLEFNRAANEKGGPRISAARSRVTAWVIPTSEELMIAQHTQRLRARPGARAGVA